MNSRGGPPLLALAGALLLGYGTIGVWVHMESVREVGGVPVGATVFSTGTEFTAAAAPLALVVLVLGGMALLGRGLARRVVGAAIAVSGVAGVVAVLAGLRLALAEGGGVTPAPWAALAGALLASAGGVLCLRSPAPRPLLDERYTVEGGEPGDEEWRLAAEEPDGAE